MFLLAYQVLAAEAVERAEPGYKLRPKLHYFGHTVEELGDTRENPRREDLFGFEDMVGKVKKTASACDRRQVMLRFAQRRLMFLKQRWAKVRQGNLKRR